MNFMIDKDKRNVVRNDKTYHLTTKEYEILECLMNHPNKILSAEELYACIWKEVPYECKPIICVHVRHLREKIEEDPSFPKNILSFYGKGYAYYPS